MAATGPMTLWVVPSDASGLTVPAAFDGLGLRGNASSPVSADGLEVPASAMLGADGAGLDIALTVVLPWFLVLNAAASTGLMQAVTAEATAHLTRTQLVHLGQTLAQQPVGRARLAHMPVETGPAAALLAGARAAIRAGRADARRRAPPVQ